MTVLDLLVLAEVLMRLMSRIIEISSLVILLLEFATRVIELFLVIRSALLTRRGKERHK